MPETISFILNNQARTVTTDPTRPLLEVVREEFHLTGAKYGCGEGQCGACTMLLDDKRVWSCRVPISAAADKKVLTIEGLATSDGALSKIQQAFIDEAAYQCGFCIPGMIMAAHNFLSQNPNPTEASINAWMTRNVCRCCGYPNILRAIHRAAGLPLPPQPEPVTP